MCMMALVLAFTSAFATETEPSAQNTGRVTLLAVQGAESAVQPSALAVMLAMLPTPGFDYVVFYDETHLSLCDLTQAQTYADRGLAMDAWAAGYDKARIRNAGHHTLWNQIADLPEDFALDLSRVDLFWLPAADLLEGQWEDLFPAISQLTACGGTLRLFAAADVPQLCQKLSTFANAAVTAVANPAFDVPDLLLREAGYYHVSDAAAKEMMRRTEVQPADALPGKSVVIDRCAGYNLVGATHTYLDTAVGMTDESQPGMAVVPAPAADASAPETQPTPDSASADSAAPAEDDASADNVAESENVSAKADPVMDGRVFQVQSEVSAQQPVADELDAQLSSIVSQHQLCWYFKPAGTLQVSLKADPAVIPFSLDETLSVSLTMESASALESAQLCAVNLLESGKYQLSAVLRDASGREEPLTLTAGAANGTYQTSFPRPAAGSHAIRATIRRTDIPFAYPAFETQITVEAPAQVTAASDVAPIKLVVSPMLWHGGDTEATLAMKDYFGGSYTPVECRSYNQELVQLTPAGTDGFALTALQEGQTQLFLMARDGETSVVVPVEITNGQKLVLIEMGAALIVLLLALYTVLFARLKQPRFRKGEQLSLSIDDAEASVLPLKSYRAGGVSLWRLMVLSGKAVDYKADSAMLKRIVFMPKLDQVIVKNNKSAEAMIPGQRKLFPCGDHTIAVTLEAADPNA